MNSSSATDGYCTYCTCCTSIALGKNIFQPKAAFTISQGNCCFELNFFSAVDSVCTTGTIRTIQQQSKNSLCGRGVKEEEIDIY